MYRRFRDVRNSLRRTVPPSGLPITLAEAKTALDLGSDTGSDDEINGLIPVAVEMVERDSQRALLAQTWRVTMDEFPCTIELRMPPVSAVTSVKYYDDSGTEVTLATTEYETDIIASPGLVTPVTTWPPTECRPGAVNVTFTAGYPGSIPRVAFNAIVLALRSLYNGCEPGAAYWSQIDRLKWDGSL